MLRRIHVPVLQPGRVNIDDAEAHHLRDVLRLADGETVELFDDSGAVARGTLILAGKQAQVLVERVEQPGRSWQITVASAVPKGERADWMIEKLSELGVGRFIPLAAERSVVLPQGEGKRQRWLRIATESAKQSRRSGVMQIDALTEVPQLLPQIACGWYLSTAPGCRPLLALAGDAPRSATLLIGPEGGWTESEIALFAKFAIAPAQLTGTILRVETAAITAAAVLMCQWDRRVSQSPAQAVE